MRTFKQHIALTEVKADKSYERFGRDAVTRMIQQYDWIPDGLQKRLKAANVWHSRDTLIQYAELASVNEFSAQKMIGVFNSIFEYFAKEVDPAGGKYTLWILDIFVHPYSGFHLSDVERVREALIRYHGMKQKKMWTAQPDKFQATAEKWDSTPEEVIRLTQNISFFTKLSDLEEFLNLVLGKDTRTASLQKYIDNGGVTMLAQNENGYVLKLNTVEASVALYRGPTAWCTARPGNSYFAKYSAQAPLIVMKYEPLDLLVQGHNTSDPKQVRPMEIQILDQRDVPPEVAFDQIDDILLNAFCKAIGLSKAFVLVYTGSKAPEESKITPKEGKFLLTSGKAKIENVIRYYKPDPYTLALHIASRAQLFRDNPEDVAKTLKQAYSVDELATTVKDLSHPLGRSNPSGPFWIVARQLGYIDSKEAVYKGTYSFFMDMRLEELQKIAGVMTPKNFASERTPANTIEGLTSAVKAAMDFHRQEGRL